MSGCLTREGYDAKMPRYLQKGNNQNIIEEANTSRLGTKVGWVVKVSTHGLNIGIIWIK